MYNQSPIFPPHTNIEVILFLFFLVVFLFGFMVFVAKLRAGGDPQEEEIGTQKVKKIVLRFVFAVVLLLIACVGALAIRRFL